MRVQSILIIMLMSGLSKSALAEVDEANTIYMDETYISGNQELPKVLYILPWKNQQGEAVPLGNPRLADSEVLAPIYPHEYRLEMSYRALTNETGNIPNDTTNNFIKPGLRSTD